MMAGTGAVPIGAEQYAGVTARTVCRAVALPFAGTFVWRRNFDRNLYGIYVFIASGFDRGVSGRSA